MRDAAMEMVNRALTFYFKAGPAGLLEREGSPAGSRAGLECHEDGDGAATGHRLQGRAGAEAGCIGFVSSWSRKCCGD